MNTTIDAVVFDMDGLLLDTERIALDTYLETAARLGIDASEELFATFVGKNWPTTRALMEKALGADAGRRMLGGWVPAFEDRVRAGGIPTKPGADRLLSTLSARGTPMALATSTERRRATMNLEAVGLVDYFPVITTGDEVARGKPAPDIFLLTAERLGIAPGRCLALEDSEPGVESASAAGMRVVMIPDLRPPSPAIAALAEAVCGSLVLAQDYLETLLAD